MARRTRKSRSANRTGRRCSIEESPFRRLLETDTELGDARRRYAGVSSEERRKAADLTYHGGEADRFFAAVTGRDTAGGDPWRAEVTALAIDPEFAPAILTVGTLEYELGRRAEALELLGALCTLPGDTEDLPVVIDKAGTYLTDKDDLTAALDLYLAAAEASPDVALHHDNVGYCLGKLGRLEKAVEFARRAVELEPQEPRWLSNLGWALCEAGQLEDAEELLERAVALAPPDDELPQANLGEVRRRRSAGGGDGS